MLSSYSRLLLLLELLNYIVSFLMIVQALSVYYAPQAKVLV